MSVRTGFAYLDYPWSEGVPGIVAMAHRGGAKHPELIGAENTRLAFAHAVDLGYRYLETDLHASRDGVLFAFHDAELSRLTGRAELIAELTAAEIDEVRILDGQGRAHPIPRFTDLWEEFAQARFNVDLKTPNAAPLLAEFLTKVGANDRMCVGSFDAATMRQFRRACSTPVPVSCAPLEVATWLPPTPLRLHRALLRRVQRLAGLGGTVLQVPATYRGIPVVTPGFVTRAHQLNCHVHVWTIDEPAVMGALLDRGIDGLITDRTDLLRAELGARGQWRP